MRLSRVISLVHIAVALLTQSSATKYWKKAGYGIELDREKQTLVVCALPYEQSNCISSEYCQGTSECHYKIFNQRSRSKLTLVDFEIRFFIIHPETSGRTDTCVVDNDFLKHIDSMPPLSASKCSKKIINYSPQVIDGVDIGINGWFMNRNHFQDLRKKNSTVLYVPKGGTVRLFVGVAFLGRYECFAYHNNMLIKYTTKDDRRQKFRRFMYEVYASKEGNYTFLCSSKYQSALEKSYLTITKKKAVHIHRVGDPSVIILDHPDSLVFPVGIKIATVNISIFSSLDVSTVKVVKEDGTALTGISLVKAQFVAGYNHYYQVVFYQPSSTFNGTYRVEATIDGSVTNPHATTFSVRMSDYPQITIVPSKKEIGIGQSTSFDCIATGLHLPEVVWEREGDLQLGSNMLVERVNSRESHSVAYRLSIQNARNEDSGLYICTAKSIHDKHFTRKEATLIVFQPGSNSIDPTYRPINTTYYDETENEDSLDITEEELYTEWGEVTEDSLLGAFSQLSNFRLLMIGIAVLCVLLGVLALFLVICVICCCTKERRLPSFSQNESLMNVNKNKYVKMSSAKSERKELLKGENKKKKKNMTSGEQTGKKGKQKSKTKNKKR